MRYIPTLLAILFAISVHSTLVSTSVADIRIISTWQGWGAERSDLLIKPAGGGYVAQNRPIPAASVSRLLAALEARDIPQPDTS
ncbi:MAG: hypothetical protein JO091_10335, partial [Acidobacteriaceae bacterium]|nr:hypothetical protein [Acidobacteriaceae bacterium]